MLIVGLRSILYVDNKITPKLEAAKIITIFKKLT